MAAREVNQQATAPGEVITGNGAGDDQRGVDNACDADAPAEPELVAAHGRADSRNGSGMDRGNADHACPAGAPADFEPRALGVPEESRTHRACGVTHALRMSSVEQNRREIMAGMQRARLKHFWKYQLAAHDFYHDFRHERPYVQTSVSCLIVASFLCQAAQRQLDPNPDSASRRHKGLWPALDAFFNVAFTIELLLNMYGSWAWRFLRRGWNLFDVLVVVVGSLDMLPFMDVPPLLKFVRVVRTLRVFRLFGRVEALRKIVFSVQSAIPGMASIMFAVLILMSIYADLAVSCFHDLYAEHCVEEVPLAGSLTARGECYGEEYYGTFLGSLYTLFQILTGESWSEAGVRPVIHYYQNVQRDGLSAFGVSLFFVSFVLILSVVFLNVVVAMLLDGMNHATLAADDEMPVADDGQLASSTASQHPSTSLAERVAQLHIEFAHLREKIDLLTQKQSAKSPPPLLD